MYHNTCTKGNSPSIVLDFLEGSPADKVMVGGDLAVQERVVNGAGAALAGLHAVPMPDEAEITAAGITLFLFCRFPHPLFLSHMGGRWKIQRHCWVCIIDHNYLSVHLPWCSSNSRTLIH